MRYLTQKKIIMIFFRMKMHLTKNKGDFALRKTKILTKAAAVVSAAVMALGCAMPVAAETNSTASYNLEYVENAPTGIYKNSTSCTIRCSGNEYIVLNSKKFSSYISGGYMHCDSSYYKIIPTNISSVGSYKIYYQGDTVPKKNRTVTINLELINCSPSKHIISKGTVTG